MAGGRRQEILDAVRALQASGQQPSVRAVRKHLGHGSFSTITAVLRTLEQEGATTQPHTSPPEEAARDNANPSPEQPPPALTDGYAPAQEPSLAVLEQPALQANLLGALRPEPASYAPAHKGTAPAAEGTRVQPLREAGPPVSSHAQLDALSALSTALAEALSANRAMSEQLGALSAALRELETRHEEQLKLAYERYESVQKYALNEVALARDEATRLREKLRERTAGVRSREDVFAGKHEALRAENVQLREEVARLAGRLQERAGDST